MINCNVCHQRQKDVIITKCWHMFCQHCIKRNLGGCARVFGAGAVRWCVFEGPSSRAVGFACVCVWCVCGWVGGGVGADMMSGSVTHAQPICCRGATSVVRCRCSKS